MAVDLDLRGRPSLQMCSEWAQTVVLTLMTVRCFKDLDNYYLEDSEVEVDDDVLKLEKSAEICDSLLPCQAPPRKGDS
jgi:hypothetical protein